MKYSQSTKSVMVALFEASAKIENPKKNKTAETGKYSYSYADLEAVVAAIKPVALAGGLLILQGNGFEGSVYGLFTRITHVESGEWIESFIPMDFESDPQDQGKENTYFKRYALVNLFGLVAEDDMDAAGVRRRGRAPQVNNVNRFPGPAKATSNQSSNGEFF